MANDQKKNYRTTPCFALVLVFVLLLFSVVGMKSGTVSPWNGGQPGIPYGSMPGNAAPSPWPAAQGMPMSATLSPWQAATAMPQQNVPGMESNPLPLSVGAGAIVPAYGVVGSEVAMPAESADSSSSGLDPSLEAIMRQAQAGLFVLPGRRNA